MSDKPSAIVRALTLVALATLLFEPRPVYAYVDPNTSGWLFQMFMPVFTALMGLWLFLRRLIVERIRSLWFQLTSRRRKS